MTQEKLHLYLAQVQVSVRKIREILRLKYEVGMSNRAIARACCISNSTVVDYVVRARRAGLVWPLAEEQTEEELYKQLFPEVRKPKLVERPQPDWEKVHRDLARRTYMLHKGGIGCGGCGWYSIIPRARIDQFSF